MSNAIRSNKNRFISYLAGVRIRADRLITFADVAVELRDKQAILQASAALSQTGHHTAGALYEAIADRRRSHATLQDIGRYGSELLRAKALITLGLNEFEKGNLREAQAHYREASRLAVGDSLISLHAAEMTAQIYSLEGNHQQALNLLTSALPLAQGRGPHFFNHLNSLSVELNATGQYDAARHYSKLCLASPFAPAYPEWADTLAEINEKSRPASRCRVAVEPAPRVAHNVVSIFRRSGIAMGDVRRFPVKQDARTETAASRLIRFVVDDSVLTEDQLDALASIAEKIARHNPSKDQLDRLLGTVDGALSALR